MKDFVFDHDTAVSIGLKLVADSVTPAMRTQQKQNFVTIGLEDKEGTQYEVTVRRVDGEVPAKVITNLLRENKRQAEALDELHAFFMHMVQRVDWDRNNSPPSVSREAIAVALKGQA